MEPKSSPDPVDSSIPANVAAASAAPRVIGLYGLPGCGKSYIMQQLKQELGETDFHYFEGSEVIDTVTDQICKIAIDNIKSTCAQSGKAGIVTGHFMFWDDEANEQALKVCTQADLCVYTYILYVNAPLEMTAKQRAEDTKRGCLNVSIQHLHHWQETEIQELYGLCPENNILFATIYPNLKDKLASSIHDFWHHNETCNRSVAEQLFNEIISPNYNELTLAVGDTSVCFWKIIHKTKGEEDPLNVLFWGLLKYLYTAFRQAMLLYKESANNTEFDVICNQVAAHTRLYPQMSSLLHQVGGYRHICSVIVTCRLRRVWEKILEKEGLSDVVKVVGGGCIIDRLVVTPSVKECLAACAQQVHTAYTWAFGDSPAIVMVGEQQNRSKSMDQELLTAMVSNRLQACQALLPNNLSPPQLDVATLPVVNLTGTAFLDSIFQLRKRPGGMRLYDAMDTNAAKLLSTPMRDDTNRGPPLYLVELIGTEKLTMRHPQGKDIAGYQLLGKEQTLIVVLMRGGQPMASEINGAVCIIIIAGVIQDQAVKGCSLIHAATCSTELTVVALCLLKNKYTGKGTTNTRNRLFNTTHLS
ncbi:hypothetical protein BDW71DRAFT_200619 [Aspergillus fruticulosus]